MKICWIRFGLKLIFTLRIKANALILPQQAVSLFCLFFFVILKWTTIFISVVLRRQFVIPLYETATKSPDGIFCRPSARSPHPASLRNEPIRLFVCWRGEWKGSQKLKQCFSRLQIDQSSLGLPSRDYYLNKTAHEKVSPLALVSQ